MVPFLIVEWDVPLLTDRVFGGVGKRSCLVSVPGPKSKMEGVYEETINRQYTASFQMVTITDKERDIYLLILQLAIWQATARVTMFMSLITGQESWECWDNLLGCNFCVLKLTAAYEYTRNFTCESAPFSSLHHTCVMPEFVGVHPHSPWSAWEITLMTIYLNFQEKTDFFFFPEPFYSGLFDE